MMHEQSYLIQRLIKPRNSNESASGPFSFGGGLRNGGLSEDALILLRGVFTFDYMGAAEFEFGAVPEALKEIADKSDQLSVSSFEIDLETVDHFLIENPRTGTATIWILAPTPWHPEIQERITNWATDDPDAMRLKETTMLPRALHGDEGIRNPCGWLELDNGYFFFTDEEMCQQVAELFGVNYGNQDRTGHASQ